MYLSFNRLRRFGFMRIRFQQSVPFFASASRFVLRTKRKAEAKTDLLIHFTFFGPKHNFALCPPRKLLFSACGFYSACS